MPGNLALPQTSETSKKPIPVSDQWFSVSSENCCFNVSHSLCRGTKCDCVCWWPWYSKLQPVASPRDVQHPNELKWNLHLNGIEWTGMRDKICIDLCDMMGLFPLFSGISGDTC